MAMPYIGTVNVSLGPVEPNTMEQVEVTTTDEEKARLQRMVARPSLGEILNLHDFEVYLPSCFDFPYPDSAS